MGLRPNDAGFRTMEEIEVKVYYCKKDHRGIACDSPPSRCECGGTMEEIGWISYVNEEM